MFQTRSTSTGDLNTTGWSMIQHMGKCRNEGEASRSKQYCTISCQCKDLRARRSSQRALRTRTACTIARATALHTAFHTRYGGQIWVVAVGRCTGQTAAARNLQDMCRTDAAPQHVLHCGCAAGCDAGILTLRASGWQARAHRGQGGRASGGVVFVCVWLGAGYMCGGDACTWTSQRGSPVLYDVHGGRGAKRYGVNGCRTQLGSARVCMGGGGTLEEVHEKQGDDMQPTAPEEALQQSPHGVVGNQGSSTHPNFGGNPAASPFAAS